MYIYIYIYVYTYIYIYTHLNTLFFVRPNSIVLLVRRERAAEASFTKRCGVPAGFWTTPTRTCTKMISALIKGHR